MNIIEKLENWLKIKLENGAEGWIKSKGIKTNSLISTIY